MKSTTLLLILSFSFLYTSCNTPPKKCPKIKETKQALAEKQAPDFTIGPNDNQTAINLTSYEETQYWKGKMNKRLAKIKQIYEKVDWIDAQHKARFFKNLDASQKAFEAYLSAQVELQYPKAEEDEWWGSGIPPCINLIYTQHFKNRYLELERWEKGTPSGEMCGGSALTQFDMEEMSVIKN
jgi:hypothetical protein